MFLGIDWSLALMKMSFQVVFSIVTGFVFCFCWNGIAPIYFASLSLPTVWLCLTYWGTAKMVLLITFFGEFIQKLTPQIIKIQQ